MGHRAHYTFKYKNQYINNVYQHWGADDQFAINNAKQLFSRNFLNINEVVDFIINEKLLDLDDFLLKIRNYDEDDYWNSMSKKFMNKIKKEKNIFDNELKKIDYNETFQTGKFPNMKIHFDIEASYLFDLDQKILFSNFDDSKLFEYK